MLMNDKQVAVNDVILSLREAADHYADAAQAIDDEVAADAFVARCRACSETADALESHIRRLGELPRRPDPEREALEQLLTRLGASLQADDRVRYAHALAHKEEGIEEAAAGALRQPLPEDTLAVMEKVRNEAAEQKARLEEIGS
ncbi:hypothetical protein BH24PSE2_BH24PSE2_22570 [soil metagenome]